MRAAALLLAGLGAAVAIPVAATAQRPPNVVLIIADDQAFADFGFMGSTEVATPRLDTLATAGAVFRRGYVPTALCRPSLLSIATGLYPHQHGVTGNDPRAGVDRARLLGHIEHLDTLPALLARHGYRCLQTGKWWEGSFAHGGFTAGMTHGDPARGGRHGDEGLGIGRETMAPVREFIDECLAAERPFFVWYAPFLPHTPHDPPERLLAPYRQPGESEHVARYRANCTRLDETCGELLDHLDARGVAEDTLVLFVVDNGWLQRPDRPGFAARSKRTPYEAGVRTPIVLRWPGRIAPAVRDTPVSSIDLAPTILRACGVAVPQAMHGNDLLGVAAGTEPARARVFGASFEHDVVAVDDPARSATARFVVEGRHKLIDWTDGRPRELYDVVADPREERDLAAAEPRRVAELRAALDAWWPARPRARPNFVLLLTDDQRWDQLGCAGHPVLQTPNIDQLAARGVRFENAFVTTSICAASRASILTGLYEGSHHFTFGTPPLGAKEAASSLPTLLRAAGYRTGFVGKWGIRVAAKDRTAMWVSFAPLAQSPYRRPDPAGVVRHTTEQVGDRAIEFLRAAAAESADGPFFLQVSFHAPHADDGNPEQYVWPSALDGLYDDAEVPPPIHAEPEFFAALPPFQRESLNRVRWTWRFDDEEKRRRMTRGYWRMITGVDRAVGRILDELETLGRERDTVILFTSDNGYFLGERGFAGKWTIHRESTRVPLIVLDPRRDQPGRVAPRWALNVDLAPTMLELAQIAVPDSYQGASLVPILRGDEVAWRHDFFYEHRYDHDKIPKSEGVRGERWVYARYYEEKPVWEELYDLDADPTEARNLARDPGHREALTRMRARCAELRGQLVR